MHTLYAGLVSAWAYPWNAWLKLLLQRAPGFVYVTLVETHKARVLGGVVIIDFISSTPFCWLGWASESPGFAVKAAPTGFASGAIYVGAVSTANGVGLGFVATINIINNTAQPEGLGRFLGEAALPAAYLE